jgi:ferredoxin
VSVSLRIDGKIIEAESGSTIWEAAGAAGISIPSLCHAPGLAPRASCMLCAVEDEESGRILPACETTVREGMHILSASPSATAVRRRSLSLLLSEHAGDCRAPCARACPTGIDSQVVIAALARGDLRGSFLATLDAAPFPAILGLLCAGPCEKACLRGRLDDALPIRSVHTIHDEVIDRGFRVDAISPKSGREGPAVRLRGGLAAMAAAVKLRREGYAVSLELRLPGTEGREDLRPAFQRELEVMAGAGIRLGDTEGQAGLIELPGEEKDLAFPARAFRLGRHAAQGILDGGSAEEHRQRIWESCLTEPTREELKELADGLPSAVSADASAWSGQDQSRFQACLSCGCSRRGDCRLIDLAQSMPDVRPLSGFPRRRAGRRSEALEGGELVYESGKCILCLRCLRLLEAASPPADARLCLRGRGAESEITGFKAVSGHLGRNGLPGPGELAAICPTGALHFVEGVHAS